MDINLELKSHIVDNTDNILLVFPSEYLKNLFIKEFNPSKNFILLSKASLLHALVGLRYKDYRYVNQDVFYRLKYKKVGK